MTSGAAGIPPRGGLGALRPPCRFRWDC